MLDMIDKTTVTITISGIELMALEKLSIVSHVLAGKLDHRAGVEQETLVSVLDDLIRQIKIKSAMPSSPSARRR